MSGVQWVNYMYFHRYTLGTFAVIVITIFYGKIRIFWAYVIFSITNVSSAFFSLETQNGNCRFNSQEQTHFWYVSFLFLILFHSLMSVLRCLSYEVFLDTFVILIMFFTADKSPPMIKKTICTPCTTPTTPSISPRTPPLRPFSAFETSVYGDPRSFGSSTPYIRRRDIC